jgi:hypothetical protein
MEHLAQEPQQLTIKGRFVALGNPMNVTINEKKLLKLKELVLATGGEYSAEQLAPIKIHKDELDAYQAELPKRWPDEFTGGEDEPEAASAPAPAAAAPNYEALTDTVVKAVAPVGLGTKPAPKLAVTKAFRYIDEHNHVHDLEVAKETAGAVFLRRPVVKDLVTVLVKGQPVEIDMLDLATKNQDDIHPVHGVANKILWTLCVIAKG